MNKIIVTTDIHGQYTDDDFATGNKAQYGLSKLKPFIDQVKDENTILIDNGDFFQGSPLNTHYFKFHQFVNPAIKAINYMGYDYYNFGNHDFNYGVKELEEFVNNIVAKVITTNVKIKDSQQQFTIHTFPDGMKVALIGITTDFVNVWEQPANLSDVEILDSYNTLKQQIKLAKSQNPDYIIGIYHGGIEKDLETGTIITSKTGENKGHQFCQDLDLDILITGHEHRNFVTKIGDVLVTQSSNRGQSFVVIELTDTPQATITYANELTVVDEEMNDLFSNELRLVNNWLDQDVSSFQKGDLIIKNPYQARITTHPVFSFIGSVMKSMSDVDINSCGLSYEAPGFNHNIKIRDVLATFPFNNTIYVYKTDGATLIKYLNHSADFFRLNEQGEIIITPEKIYPKNELFNYEVVNGLKYEIVVEENKSEVVNVSLNGEPILLDHDYQIAMTNYRASGAGDYTMVDDMELVREISTEFNDAFIDFLIKNPIIDVNDDKNIKIYPKHLTH